MSKSNARKRAEFHQALSDLDDAYQRVRDLSWKLPKLPLRGTDEADLIEGGLSRWETVEKTEDGKGWMASARGYDAYSDEGRFTYVEWNGRSYAAPEDIDWH